MNENTLLTELERLQEAGNAINNDEPAEVLIATGLQIAGTLLKHDSRKGTALVRQDNADGTYTITSITNVITIKQTRKQGE